jgi:hypothetical protein
MKRFIKIIKYIINNCEFDSDKIYTEIYNNIHNNTNSSYILPEIENRKRNDEVKNTLNKNVSIKNKKTTYIYIIVPIIILCICVSLLIFL